MKLLKKIAIFLMLILIGASCTKEIPSSKLPADHLVTMESAIEMIKQKTAFRPPVEGITSRADDFEVRKSFTLNDENGLAGIHAITYVTNEKTMFSLVFADDRLPAIIAYGNGPFDQENIAEGLAVWMKGQLEMITDIRNKKLTKKQVFEDIIQARVEPQEDPCEGQNYIVQRGPLLTTAWGQGCYYNDNLSFSCPLNCGFELTGCVATAMAQVMKYHEHPNDYDWSLMLDSYSGIETNQQVDEVATLMLDIGTAIDTDWDCAASGVSGQSFGDNVPSAFDVDFNYSNGGTLQELNYPQPIIGNINAHKPVIFVGVEAGNGHAWVGDGYREHGLCEVDEQSGQVFAGVYTFFHMNWGWEGDMNGWFGYSSWGGYYNDDQYVLFNITP